MTDRFQASPNRRAEIDALLAEQPPPDHTGHHFYFEDRRTEPELLGLLVDTPACTLAEALIHPRQLQTPPHLGCRSHSRPRRTTIGPAVATPTALRRRARRPARYLHHARRHHPVRPEPRLHGQLWVWPGTHRQLAAHLTSHGPDALIGPPWFCPIR